MAKQPSNTGLKRTSKVYLVPLAKMRVPTAGIAQREFRPAWGTKLAKNLELASLGLVVLNLRDGIFWIIDGQHRIYALRENGFKEDSLECEVFENLTDEEMAAIFVARNTRKAVHALDHFLVSCTAGDPRALSIRRAVESNGSRIGRNKNAGDVTCVNALASVYDAAGEVVLGQVVRTLRGAFHGDAWGFDRLLVEGLGQVFNRYNGHTNEKALIESLSNVQHGARTLIRRAQSQRERTGNALTLCVAAAIVDVYNKHMKPASRLKSWWKEAA